jgi:Flp pilus assembly protein TadG
MSGPRQTFAIKLLRQTKGSAMLEFALVAGLLLLIVIAILDFGHAWFMRQAIINASREGARYAVVYRVRANGTRMPPSEFTPSVPTVAGNYLSGMLPSGDYNVPAPTGLGYTTGNAGQEVTVTINATKRWFALDAMVALFGGTLDNPIILTAVTTMRCE